MSGPVDFKVGDWACWVEGAQFSVYRRRGKVTAVSTGSVVVKYKNGERTFRRNRHGEFSDALRRASDHEVALWAWAERWRGFKRLHLRESDGDVWTVQVHDQRCDTVEQVEALLDEVKRAHALMLERPVKPARGVAA